MKRAAQFIVAAILSAFLFTFALPAYAGTINVTDFSDAGTGCTLREAITRANAGSDGLGCTGVTASPNTIVLPAGDYTISSVLPLVTTTITIAESGGDTNIQANASPNVAAYGIISVNNPGNLTLDGVTVRNGGNDTSFMSNGGCISVGSNAALTVQNGAVIEGCRNTAPSDGGAISINTGATATITNSIVRNNITGGNGGVTQAFGTLTITNSLFSNNRTAATSGGNGFGGAIACLTGCTLSITGAEFSANTAANTGGNARGGAIYIGSNTAAHSISGSMFTNNTANGSIAGNGGAIYHVLGLVNITTSRFETNTAGNGGGAIYSNSTDFNLNLAQSCITDNGDTAVFDGSSVGTIDASGGGVATSNWWGTSWGPRIAAVGGGSALSNGDSINGNGDTVISNVLVDVNLSSPGTDSSSPTGSWLASAPADVAGDNCMVCTEISSTGHGRTCTRP